MNERIRELAEQAVQLVAGEHNKGDESRLNTDSYHVKDLINEKFAELIVAECMDIAKQVENDKFDVAGSAEPEYRKGINDGRRNAAWGIKNRIKLHFGVEE